MGERVNGVMFLDVILLDIEGYSSHCIQTSVVWSSVCTCQCVTEKVRVLCCVCVRACVNACVCACVCVSSLTTNQSI